jgi:hypothetical protein
MIEQLTHCDTFYPASFDVQMLAIQECDVNEPNDAKELTSPDRTPLSEWDLLHSIHYDLQMHSLEELDVEMEPIKRDTNKKLSRGFIKKIRTKKKHYLMSLWFIVDLQMVSCF